MNQQSDTLIYVVDDEPMLLELAETLLAPCGYTTRTFPDGDAALRAFAEAKPRPALVITDYAMHPMTGLDLIRECRALEPRQRILMVSGTVDEDIFRNSKAKPDRFLAKPYQGKQFLHAVESLLAG
ncbi:MAG: response regulator [Verrucomicrobiota bacterium]